MKTLYMTKGLPASGKSTWAKKKVSELGGSKCVRINKDDLRMLLHDGKWSKDNEKVVLIMRDSLILEALTNNLSVIVDDTNFSPKHEETIHRLIDGWNSILKDEDKYTIEVVDFTTVPLEVCIARDSKRLVGRGQVGKRVIKDMFDKYLKDKPSNYFINPPEEPKKLSAPTHNPKLPNCVIVDVDGTVAKKGSRSAFDETRVYEDDPIHHVIDCVRGFRDMNGSKIIFFSGRHVTCYDETVRWMKDKAFLTISDAMPLYMRPAGDSRKDYIIKRELYEKHILGKYNLVAIFDDRPQVIRECWQYLGFSDRIFNVGTGEEF